jgi:hypothetical protein
LLPETLDRPQNGLAGDVFGFDRRPRPAPHPGHEVGAQSGPEAVAFVFHIPRRQRVYSFDHLGDVLLGVAAF